MTRRRWIADEVSGNHAALTGAHAEHLVRVLRARMGQEFDIATSSVVRRGRVTSLADHRIEFELGEEVPAASTANVTLLLAVFKFDRMEWAIEKCTELGASRIVPVIARRTDAHLVSAAGKRVERWRRIALQAAEQSRRSVPPEIVAPMKLKDATSLLGDLRIVLAEEEQETQLRNVLAFHPCGGETLLAIGP
jgi:16S rRNA (uracil1498-N3)-methyltransferase